MSQGMTFRRPLGSVFDLGKGVQEQYVASLYVRYDRGGLTPTCLFVVRVRTGQDRTRHDRPREYLDVHRANEKRG